jgi:hypothetical protein
MISLVDIDDPSVVYEGRIFWDMLRPGVRLSVFGPHGCTTSVIRRVMEAGTDRYLVQTMNSRYVLTSGRRPGSDDLALAKNALGEEPTELVQVA